MLNRYLEEVLGINCAGVLIISRPYYHIISHAFILPVLTKTGGIISGLVARVE